MSSTGHLEAIYYDKDHQMIAREPYGPHSTAPAEAAYMRLRLVIPVAQDPGTPS